MKGFLVVDRLNDIQFIDTDKEFARHINEQAKEIGLLAEDHEDLYTVDPNIVMQQFSPLFMSQWFMIDHAKNPCSSIRCENDFLFVFKHFEDYLLVVINGDGSESEDFLTRKTLVFTRLIGFLMGPVNEEIGKPRFTSKMERWNYLRLLLSTWTYLAKNEQAFLVEAVEKLHMNQVVNEQCVEILQSAVNSMQEAGEHRAQHALLLVNSKLLSLYSIRNALELKSSDILCIILLVRSLFPTHEKLEDLFAQSYRHVDGNSLREEARSPATVKVPRFRHERYESAVEGFTTGDETENDEYLSAVETKVKDDSSPSLHNWSMLGDSDSGGTQSPYPEVSEKFVTPTNSPSDLKNGGKSFDLPGRQTTKSSNTSGPDKLNMEKLTAMLSDAPQSNKQSSHKSQTPQPHGSHSAMRQSFEGNQREEVRQRSHTASEIEGHAGVRGSQGDLPMGRGRSRSFGENNHRKKDTMLCSERSASDTRLADKMADEQEEVEYPSMHKDTDYVKQAVFLNTTQSKYSPYQIHCRRIYPGIILVILVEMPKYSQAQKLVDLLHLLKDLLDGQRDSVTRRQGQIMCEAISSQLAVVLMSLKKAKGHLDNLCFDIRKKWESEEVKAGIMAYLEQGPRTEIPASLERGLKFLHTKLKEMFRLLYLSPRPPTPSVTSALTSVTSLFMSQLGDYKEYLAVKAQRNITMTTYIEDFPGLVHFIYINRRTNQIMAPALNITNTGDHSSHDATQLLKDKIWSMTSWMQGKLHEGYTMVSAREGDYRYSYFLWFENCSGEPVVIQRPYRADSSAPPPGILTGNFYKYITHKCFPNITPNSVHCNELLMMHVGLANTQYIANHCRHLAARLYETSGDMITNSSMFGN